MRIILLLLTAFVLISSFQPKSRVATTLKCILKTYRTEYKLGELPQLDVQIVNVSDKDISMISALDGSEMLWRMPYCYYTIEKPGGRIDTPRASRCGNTDPIREEDFVTVKPGASFNPYHKRFYPAGVFLPVAIKDPGTYKIRFYYNSNSNEMDSFDGRFNRLGSDSVAVRKLFPKAAKVSLISNEIEIRIVE
jgi:hypothetical protein